MTHKEAGEAVDRTLGSRLDSLTSARFFAALVVLLLHSTVSGDTRIVDLPAIRYVATLGFLGVPFFFALSGFVLTWSSRQGDSLGRFYQRRFARVWPLHAATWAVAVAAIIASGGDLPALGAVLSLFLLQAWVPNPSVYFAANGVSWSLSCEAFFYLVHPGLIALLTSRRVRLGVVGVLTIGAMSAMAVAQLVTSRPFEQANDLWVFPVFSLGFFILGMLGGLALREGQRVRLSNVAATVIAVLAYAVLTAVHINADTWFGFSIPQTTLGVLSAPIVLLVIVVLASNDLSGRPSVMRRPVLVRLGEWSFALYLIHAIMLRGLVDVFEFQAPIGWGVNVVVLLAVLVVAIGVSGVAYVSFERPIERLLRPRGSSLRSTMAQG